MALDTQNPAAGGSAGGARDTVKRAADNSEHSGAKPKRKAAWIVFDGGSGPIRDRIVGRELWALRCLIQAGNKGVSSLEHIGPRLSHYIFKLRGYGLAIDTVTEDHGGPYWGQHARYVLRTPVVIEGAAP